MPSRLTCPDPSVLEQLALGHLSGTDAEGLEQHLANCPDCVAALQALPAEDELVRALRPPLRPDEARPLDLARAIIPTLKRLRPRFATTWGTQGLQATERGAPREDTEEDRLSFLQPPQSPEEIGRLGGYRVLGLLGGGGMGVVFRAEDPALKRSVALKVIKPALVVSAEARARFLHEARALAALEHDHIVAVYQVGEDNGVPFLAMQMLRGQSLEERLSAAKGPLPVDEVLRHGREIAAGLAVAHSRGLIHRDIKPGNIWIESAEEGQPSAGRERVKILDFGLVQALTGDPADGQGPGAILGTPAYMAPEQALGRTVDGRADLFSLGCVLYRMATGHSPFEAEDVFGLLVRIAQDEPLAPRKLNPAVPVELERFILHLLRKTPEERPESAEAVVRALRAMEEARRPKPSRRRWLIGTAVAVLAAAGLAVWLMRTPPPEPVEVTIVYDDSDTKLALRLGDEPERVFDPKQGGTLSLPPGDYALRPVPPVEKRSLKPERLPVKPGERQTFTVRLVGEVARRRTTRDVRGLAVWNHKDGPRVVWVSDDDRLVAFWNPVGNDKPHLRDHRESRPRCVTVSPDGGTAATGSGDVGPNSAHFIRFWDLEGLEPLRGKLDCESQLNVLAYSPDGKRLLSGENNGTLQVWDLATGLAKPRELRAHEALGVFAVAFLPGGEEVLTAGGDGVIVLRAASDLKPVRTLSGHKEAVRALAVLPGAKQAVSAGLDKTIRVWDLASGAEVHQWSAPESIKCLALSPDGKRLLTGETDGKVRLWDLGTRKEIIRFDGHAKEVTSVAFTPNGRRAISGGLDGAVCLWELP